MDLREIVAGVVKVVKAAAPFIPGGAAGVAAVEAITGLVNSTKTALKENGQEVLSGQLDEALAKMNADFNKTIDSLD